MYRFSAIGPAVFALVLCSAGTGHAENRRIRVQIAASPAALPFSAQELEAAIRLRVPLGRDNDARATAVSIEALDQDRVLVRTPAHRQEVAVAGRSSGDAARVVAVMIVDLVRDDETQPTTIGHASPARAEAAAGPALVLRLFPRGNYAWGDGMELGWDTVAEAHVAWKASRVGLVAGGGYGRQTVAFPATWHTAMVHAGVAYRLSALEVRAGASARAHRIQNANTRWTVVPGAWASLLYETRVANSLYPFAIVGMDVFAERVEVRQAGMVRARAGSLLAGLGVGLGWKP